MTQKVEVGQKWLYTLKWAGVANKQSEIIVDNVDGPRAYVHALDENLWDSYGSRLGSVLLYLVDFGADNEQWSLLPLNHISSNSACICKKCNAQNEFALPNQKDGTYVCFECR